MFRIGTFEACYLRDHDFSLSILGKKGQWTGEIGVGAHMGKKTSCAIVG